MRRPGRLVLLGHPVGHSLSPAFQNAALQRGGHSRSLRGASTSTAPTSSARVDALRAENAWGNVTVPYKERMRDACDERHAARRARRRGQHVLARRRRAPRSATTPTSAGSRRAVETLLGEPPRDLTIGVLGAGGAAAGVLAAVEAWPGCWAHVYNRTPERARLLCERFRTVAEPVDDIGAIAGAQLVVNATSIGLRDDSFPMDPAMIAPESAVHRSRVSPRRNGVGSRARAAADVAPPTAP